MTRFQQSQSESHVWHPFTPVPWDKTKLEFTRAFGSFVFDKSGKSYFDATSSWWCNIHGHCNPRLVRALTDQASKLDQILLSPHTHPVVEELSERLIAVLGSQYDKVFYSDDGSTAVEAALKMSIQYWANQGEHRTKFVSMKSAYHGDTMGAVSVSAIDVYHHLFQVNGGSYKIEMPYCYRCPVGKNFPSCQLACLDGFEQMLEKNHSEIAAVILEPLVLGAAGMVVYPKEILERIVRASKKHGLLIIFDEVFTGFGRTGKMFAKDHLSEECHPDIICLSKGLTSGMLPLGATVVRSHVYQAFCGDIEKTFYHGHTFTGNALTSAVALESLKIFEDENVMDRNKILIELMELQRERFLKNRWVGSVRQIGTIWNLELVLDKDKKTISDPSNQLGWKIAEQLLLEGIWIRPLHQNIYLIPPYSSTSVDLNMFFDKLEKALEITN